MVIFATLFKFDFSFLSIYFRAVLDFRHATHHEVEVASSPDAITWLLNVYSKALQLVSILKRK